MSAPLQHTPWGALGALPKRVVIKVGSALLTPQGPLGPQAFERLAHEVLALRHAGVSVTLVSSGAIAQGRLALGMDARPQELSLAQALAAVGQPLLMSRWAEALAPTQVAQLLLTFSDIDDPLRFFNARRALRALDDLGVIAIGNENDSVATEEIKFGDNDRLGAYVAQLSGADVYVIYTQVDGLYTANPERDPNARRLSVVPQLSEVMSFAEGAGSDGWGTGGMTSKLEAAEIAHRAGTSVIIAHGQTPLLDLLRDPTLGTLLPAPMGPSEALRERWPLSGRVTITQEGKRALESGASVELSELCAVGGLFARGDLVALNVGDAQWGRALIGYNVEACERALSERAVARDPRATLGDDFDGALINAGDWVSLSPEG